MGSVPTSPDTVVHLKTPLGNLNARWEATTPDNDKNGILKCLGIQYAYIPYRWAPPRKPAIASWDGTRDYTKVGPGCPQIGRPLFGVDRVPMFGQLGSDAAGNATMAIRPDYEDELGCLNLDIYTPASVNGSNASLSDKRLPVLVWVHGGSYQVGAGSVDAYDGTSLVRRGLEIGSPVVFVTINYRLGVLGFLHSKELAASEANSNDVPPEFRSTANLALVDCKYAIDWLRENIANFGGDAENITAIGESAGAGAIHHLMTVPQLYVDIPRIILSSSTCMSIQLLRAQEAQQAYDDICEKLGAKSVEDLRKAPVEKLVEESWFASTTFRPIWDDITITSDPREAVFDSQRWNPSLKAMVLGTCRNEPWIREAAILKSGKSHAITKVIQTRIPPHSNLRDRAAQLYSDPASFAWYAVSPSLAVPEKNRCSMAFEGHCRYYTPAALMSRSLAHRTAPAKIYRYVFGYSTEHWPTDWPTTHTADILPMFLHRDLIERDRRISETFADRLLEFTAGSAPSTWTHYTAEGTQLNILDKKGEWSVGSEKTGAFDLTDELVQFWADVGKAILATGRTGWTEMAR
ncbi:hypothetical protein SCUCBS95973_007935 [Sporothrix curviconia]|uniref:Carboxylesterase type B domain-containing protein n=1 Tax=Sporothrix curviconia TaxID=1260050 RepID=A0ABP0CHR3_9PEZI